MVLLKKITSITLVLVLFISAQEQSDRIKKDGRSLTRVIQTYRFDALPDDGSYTIEINNLSGQVTIIGHEGSGAKITITNIAFEIPELDVQNAHKLSKTIVTHLEDEENIKIIGTPTLPKDIKIQKIIEIHLPKHVILNCQILGGDINVNGLKGESILETLGGDILIKNHMGRIEAKTSGGDLYINDFDGVFRGHSYGGDIKLSTSKGELSSSSIGGDIYMVDLSGKISSQTSGGKISLLRIQGREVSCNASGGLIECDEISGQINFKNSGKGINIKNADGDIELFSTGGPIFINDAKGSIKCEASIGEVEMLNISGRVETLNSNGNISLEVLYDSSIDDFGIHLETHSGDIRLDIPKGLPGNIKSTVYQSTSYKDLNSEMPLNISTFYDKVIGTRKIKEGTIPINLEAHGGTITIKEY